MAATELFINSIKNLNENESKLPYSLTVQTKIDDVIGTLIVHIYKNEPKYRIEFSWKDLILKFSKIYYNVDLNKFIQTLKDIKSYKFFGDKLIDEEDFQLHKTFRNALFEIWNEEEENCYVCHEDTCGYKTMCGHDICYKCYLKSIKHNVDEDAEVVSFKCGVCRTVQVSYDSELN